MVTPAARREAVAHLQIAYEVSERRACSALGADRTSVRYRSCRPDAALRRGLRAPSRCFTEPNGLKSIRDSAHRWMKEGAQVTSKPKPKALQVDRQRQIHP